MILEIQNPSDAITIVADDIVAAGVGIMIVSDGWYGLENENGETVVPITALGGQDKWLGEHGISDIKNYLHTNAEKIAAILETVAYGKIVDRQLFDSALSRMSSEQAKLFSDEWNDKRRSSMNNIGARCLSVASTLRELKLRTEIMGIPP